MHVDLDGFLQGIGRVRVGLSFGQQIIEPRPTNRQVLYTHMYGHMCNIWAYVQYASACTYSFIYTVYIYIYMCVCVCMRV